MYNGNGFKVRSVRVASYLVSRGWEAIGIGTSTSEFEKVIAVGDVLRMMPPASWNYSRSRKVLNYAINDRMAGLPGYLNV